MDDQEKRSQHNDFCKKCAQEHLLELMDEIHAFCVERNIKYYMIAGTLLGARRHLGFIPWDIDMDIGMFREDYDRFLEEFGKIQNPDFVLKDYRNTKKYFAPHAVVQSTKCFLILSDDYYYRPKMEPLTIDIFPLDTVPSGDEEQSNQAKRIKMLKKIQSLKECILHKHNSTLEICMKKAVQFCLLPLTCRFVNGLLDNTMKRYSSSNTGLVCSMSSQYAYKKQTMDVSLYGKPRLVAFEQKAYYAPSKPDEYLTKLYGASYMQLPPENKRCRPGEFVLDFVVN